MKIRILNKILFLFLVLFVACSCKKVYHKPRQYNTENVVIVIVDGARYSETWGDSSHQNIRFMAQELAASGVINTRFYNDGPTYTLAGHTGLCTGYYQEINNGGSESPEFPSIFQYFNAKNASAGGETWIISSKDKLEVLSNCKNSAYYNKFRPFADCGNNGPGSGYREDSVTFKLFTEVFSQRKPKLTLLSFKEPDYSAHSGNWKEYIRGIQATDRYVYEVWKCIQNDPYYRGKTALFVTNDHGRHLDNVMEGFMSHGDTCEGCRHIFLYAFGPDFKQGVIVDNKRELNDISATVAELLHFDAPYVKGKVMTELFR